MAPVVTVPVLSRTTVSTRRVDSRTSGPLMRMPSWAPRPVPTMSAVGVARPEGAGAGDDEHGHRGGERVGGVAGVGQPEAEGGGGQGDDDGDEDRRDPVGQALHRGLARLRLLDQPGDLGQRGVGADPGGPHHQAPAGVDGGAHDPVAGPDLDRHALAGEQRLVDRRRALLDDAVGGDLLARAGPRTGRRPPARRPAMRRSRPSASSTATSLAPSSSRARSAAPARRLARASK